MKREGKEKISGKSGEKIRENSRKLVSIVMAVIIISSIIAGISLIIAAEAEDTDTSETVVIDVVIDEANQTYENLTIGAEKIKETDEKLKINWTTTNETGTGTYKIIVFVDVSASGAPTITSHSPAEATVSDTEGATRTFSIATDQTVNVSWLINGTEVQTNESVTTASYTNTSAAVGTWNVSAIASNENGTAMQTWIWHVAPAEVIEIHGDLTISEAETYSDVKIILTGNLKVESGGDLTLNNVTLIMNSTSDGQYTIDVKSGGTLKLLNKTSVTAPFDRRYKFNVYGTLIMKDSTVSYLYDPIKIYSIYDGIIRFNRVLIDNSSIVHSRTDGIYLEHADQTKQFTDIKIVNSTIAHNAGNGIILMRSNALIINNIITSNGKNGIYMEYSSPKIAGNSITMNSDYGIYCYRHSHPVIEGNTILSNADGGVYLRESSNPEILENTILNNGQYGIYCDYSYPTVENCTVAGHTYNIRSYHGHPTIKDSTITP
ncbi:right-handed parallel beta-helix repeat-containing protein, partial [Methanophagales archaeon]